MVVESARREGAVAIHTLPPEESRVDTVFVRRRDAYVSSALTAFLRCARPPPRPTSRAALAAAGSAGMKRRAPTSPVDGSHLDKPLVRMRPPS